MGASPGPVGAGAAFVFGTGGVHLLLGMGRRGGYGVFAVYRVALAIGLFFWVARH